MLGPFQIRGEIESEEKNKQNKKGKTPKKGRKSERKTEESRHSEKMCEDGCPQLRRVRVVRGVNSVP